MSAKAPRTTAQPRTPSALRQKDRQAHLHEPSVRMPVGSTRWSGILPGNDFRVHLSARTPCIFPGFLSLGRNEERQRSLKFLGVETGAHSNEVDIGRRG